MDAAGRVLKSDVDVRTREGLGPERLGSVLNPGVSVGLRFELSLEPRKHGICSERRKRLPERRLEPGDRFREGPGWSGCGSGKRSGIRVFLVFSPIRTNSARSDF